MFSETGFEPSGVFASSFLISASTSVSYFNATSISIFPFSSTTIGFERSFCSLSVFPDDVPSAEVDAFPLSIFPDVSPPLQAVIDKISDTAISAAIILFICGYPFRLVKFNLLFFGIYSD